MFDLQVFWGVRELRRQFLLPVNRPVITVEVGGTKVVSDLLRSAKVNPLFEKRLKYVDLVSRYHNSRRHPPDKRIGYVSCMKIFPFLFSVLTVGREALATNNYNVP